VKFGDGKNAGEPDQVPRRSFYRGVSFRPTHPQVDDEDQTASVASAWGDVSDLSLLSRLFMVSRDNRQTCQFLFLLSSVHPVQDNLTGLEVLVHPGMPEFEFIETTIR